MGAKLTRGRLLIVILCQPEWAMGCPHMWSNIILGISERVILDEFNIWIHGLSKADWPS